MDPIASQAEQLRRRISQAERELRDLHRQLDELEAPARDPPAHQDAPDPAAAAAARPEWKWPLSEEEYVRYGRQLVLPAVGVEGQLRLRAAAVLVVGAGGLGCPAAAYLAGAGVGALGVVDGDTVEASNLHRQIAHGAAGVGAAKADSLVAYCRALNPLVAYASHRGHLTPENAEAVVSPYDLVLDCTDHPTSRYLISDICVLLRKPLVSASALRTDGQLIVLNNPPAPQGEPAGGPCYRCVFPKPPPADGVLSCGEGGILGPVVGVMGVLQALEAIKLIVGGVCDRASSAPREPAAPPGLLLFSATAAAPFRSVRMRGRRSDCFACSAGSSLTLGGLRSGSLDYVQFCGVAAPVSVLAPEERISATEYNNILTEQPGRKHLLLDVREKEHFKIASIPGAINVPYSTIRFRNRASTPDSEKPQVEYIPESLPANAAIYVVCRVGNDSQLATRRLKELGLGRNGERFIGDIKGGMQAWKREVDYTMPFT
ncbi:adenylyltransferase [Durotheca rogersii]|uniref:adenylyltransferase n=1 Tax=Durotheca rogersii TaxID=419775 RepID=UPI00221F70DA|nr:adenylyltransferase [Durotheca rogersii]KAI5867097.1 adenylyltransferase [Durotheca rogersii]